MPLLVNQVCVNALLLETEPTRIVDNNFAALSKPFTAVVGRSPRNPSKSKTAPAISSNSSGETVSFLNPFRR